MQSKGRPISETMSFDEKNFIAQQIVSADIGWDLLGRRDKKESAKLNEAFDKVEREYGYAPAEIFIACVELVCDNAGHILKNLDERKRFALQNYAISIRGRKEDEDVSI